MRPESVVVRGAGVALGEEVEGGLGAGEVAERGRRRRVEGLVGAEGLLRGGTVGEGAVEVEGVGDVELGLDVQGPGVVDVVLVAPWRGGGRRRGSRPPDQMPGPAGRGRSA